MLDGEQVYSIKHKCGDRVPMFEPGEHVLVETYSADEYEENGQSGREIQFSDYPGIFIKQLGGKGLCFIRPGTEGSAGHQFRPKNDMRNDGYVKALLGRIHKTGRADRVSLDMCAVCRNVPGLIGNCGAESMCFKITCQHAVKVSMLGGAVMMVDGEWYAPQAKEDFPF